ncbi:MAG: cation-translocating P-type ATPase [Oscillospiraceae bacterium]|nr:cation-translocating P-type ATPase [Oscillospiraceae bacterium]
MSRTASQAQPVQETVSRIAWHTLTIRECLRRLDSREDGLTAAMADERRVKYGDNELAHGNKRTLISIFFAQFSDLMIWVLIAAAALSALMREPVDTAIILFVVIVNAILGTVQESKAEHSLEALKKMSAPTAKVMRNGTPHKIPAGEITVGDVIILEAGDSVPADIRLLTCNSLKVEESALTGESVPVEKICANLDDADLPLGDRFNMAYMGTAVTYGRAIGVVCEIGMSTEIGTIAEQLASSEKETTPLQKKLNQISNVLSVGVLCIAAVIFGISILMKGWGSIQDSFLLAISLAVAAIPEGMVAVVTIVLAMGMSRMAAKNAIIRRLPAVETLGSTQVICSDKTGTLTQNRMTVRELFAEKEDELLEAMLHCNDAALDKTGKAVGDPTETALLDYLLDKNLAKGDNIRERTRAGEIPFDSERKLSTVAVRIGDSIRLYVKGAPDILLKRCIKGNISAAESANSRMAVQALRVLAFAYKDVQRVNLSDTFGSESGLTFCGLAGMLDPARPEAKASIAVCRAAGILPVMITGDHKETAVAIANDLGILGDGRKAVTGQELALLSDTELEKEVNSIGVYARVAPEHKTRIVSAWQKLGKIVSMTGDGVNDAPALKTADIGVGMGITGTDVSKGASDMVLTDDNFATIVTAVGEGRRIFDNIHKTVRFLLSSNAGEVIAILAATLLNWNLLAAIHILWVNLVTDTFPALALGIEPAEPDIMTRKPRDQKTPFFTGREWFRVLIVGAFEAFLTLGAYMLGGGGVLGTTMAFLTLSLSQLFAAVGFQSERNSVFNMKLKDHPMLWLAFIGSGALQVLVVLIPPLRTLFRLVPLGWLNWMQVIALCLCMLLFIELQKFIAKHTKS